MRGIVGNTPLRSFIDKGQVGVDWGGLIKRSEVCYVRKYLVHWRGGGRTRTKVWSLVEDEGTVELDRDVV
jgi:hypothetical protein